MLLPFLMRLLPDLDNRLLGLRSQGFMLLPSFCDSLFGKSSAAALLARA